ncbi:hypothetical protein RHMOL_Rhmol05G0129000 [Rhododendron molle]|uniref:Uncharacterized protein n=1 Tax=Rhododendron molle TaxID=49168 RepID=A0ACC0NPE8_RHOML|nr:hypothetical protein RHMOL_Rhmol05G0129000 [Rhododendron molle]
MGGSCSVCTQLSISTVGIVVKCWGGSMKELIRQHKKNKSSSFFLISGKFINSTLQCKHDWKYIELSHTAKSFFTS